MANQSQMSPGQMWLERIGYLLNEVLILIDSSEIFYLCFLVSHAVG
jgi:hypothetical protein